MKAEAVGKNRNSRVLDHFAYVFNWHSYIHAKYDGLFPSNYPTFAELKELKEKIKEAKDKREFEVLSSLLKVQDKITKIQRKVAIEWRKQQ